LSHKPEDWNTPTRKRNGEPGKPLEQMIYDVSLKALESAVRDHTFLIDDGEKEARYIRQAIDVKLPDGCVVQGPNGLVIFDACHLEMAFQVTQTRMVIDRGAKFDYALAVEDCIDGQRLLASRKVGSSESVWRPTREKRDTEVVDEDTLQNGSIMKITMSAYFDPSQLPADRADEEPADVSVFDGRDES
jgi:hypothetical protein